MVAGLRSREAPGGRTGDEDRVRSGGEVRSQSDRDRVPARRERADADGPRVSAAGRRAVPDLARPARWRWNNKDRGANEPMDRAVAASGVLVVAVDLTLAPEAPYPASVQDGNYGVRWLKSKAAEWNGDAASLGVLGSSSGGHVAELRGMRPRA